MATINGQAIRFLPANDWRFSGALTTGVRESLQDDTVNSVIHLYTSLLLSEGWELQPLAGETDPNETELFEQINTQTEGWQTALVALTQTPFTAFTVVEIIYQRYMPVRFRVIPNDLVSMRFEVDGSVRQILVRTLTGEVTLPPERALFMSHAPTIESPQGTTRLEPVITALVREKKIVERNINTFIERFASPFVFARYDRLLSASEQDELWQQLLKVQSSSVAMFPGTADDDLVSVQFLSPTSTNGIEFAEAFLQQYNRRVAINLLGPILAIYESLYGTRAQADVHYRMLKNVIKSEQQVVEEVINSQLWQPVVRYQLGREPTSRLILREPEVESSQQLAQWVLDLTSAGYLDPVADRDLVRSRFEIPPTEGSEPTVSMPEPTDETVEDE